MKAVSYTHLDVYKRQIPLSSCQFSTVYATSGQLLYASSSCFKYSAVFSAEILSLVWVTTGKEAEEEEPSAFVAVTVIVAVPSFVPVSYTHLLLSLTTIATAAVLILPMNVCAFML